MGYYAGHYTATWNAIDIGDTENGFTIKETPHRDAIQGDSGGQTELDAIQAGCDVEVTLSWIEYDKIVASGVLYGQFPAGQPLANVGKSLVSLAKQLVLTPVAGTSANKTFTFYKAIVITDVETMLSYKHTKGPLTLRCYPDPANGGKAYTAA